MGTVIAAGAYRVHVGRGLLGELPAIVRESCPARCYAVIADHRVAELHAPRLLDRLGREGMPARLFTFPAGEWNKTRAQWSELTDRMLAAGIGRDGAVIAFGGGVAGDLGGFVAATYLRGVPVVQVPTSLLAMIDSSIGGKTGVDVPAGKNLVGAFHPPRAVVADVELLTSLGRPQLAAGMAEAVKHGVIGDAAYYASLADPEPVFSRDLDALESVVAGSLTIKAAIVRRDEREAGERQVLNFGHTVGHAVETAAGYELLHGEAVAVGMVVEATIAEAAGVAAKGLRTSILATLESYGLPTRIPEELSTETLLELMARDKKVRGGSLRFALPSAIGVMSLGADAAWTLEINERVIRQALDTGR